MKTQGIELPWIVLMAGGGGGGGLFPDSLWDRHVGSYLRAPRTSRADCCFMGSCTTSSAASARGRDNVLPGAAMGHTTTWKCVRGICLTTPSRSMPWGSCEIPNRIYRRDGFIGDELFGTNNGVQGCVCSHCRGPAYRRSSRGVGSCQTVCTPSGPKRCQTKASLRNKI